MDALFFYLALAFILTHEMDAIRCHEWRIFPLISRLASERSYLVFTALHVPLYLLLFWFLFRGGELNRGLVVGLDIFFIVHVGLHVIFLRHPENRFTSLFSWILIIGAGVAGVLDLVVG